MNAKLSSPQPPPSGRQKALIKRQRTTPTITHTRYDGGVPLVVLGALRVPTLLFLRWLC